MGEILLFQNVIAGPSFVPLAATGGTITDVNIGGVNYRIHAFTSTGTSTFTVTDVGTNNDKTVDVLIVAGGGGGGAQAAIPRGKDGGSGGGGGYPDDSPNGAGLALQPSSSSGGFGNNGGAGNTSPNGGGGGGGAGGVGGTNSPVPGGPGLDMSSKFTTAYGENGWFAGGGGGSNQRGYPIPQGGIGGGGTGTIYNGTQSTPGQSNTGGGGGAGGNDGTGKDGGSGIVLIRYRLDPPS